MRFSIRSALFRHTAHPQISVYLFRLVSDLTELSLQLEAAGGWRGEFSHRRRGAGWWMRMMRHFCLCWLFGLFAQRNSGERECRKYRLVLVRLLSLYYEAKWCGHLLVKCLCGDFRDFFDLDNLSSGWGRQRGGFFSHHFLDRRFRTHGLHLNDGQLPTHLFNINPPQWFLRDITCLVIS